MDQYQLPKGIVNYRLYSSDVTNSGLHSYTTSTSDVTNFGLIRGVHGGVGGGGD